MSEITRGFVTAFALSHRLYRLTCGWTIPRTPWRDRLGCGAMGSLGKRRRVIGEWDRGTAAAVADRLSELGLSATWLAREAGLNRRTVSRILTGEHPPTPQELGLLGTALGLHPTWLLRRDLDVSLEEEAGRLVPWAVMFRLGLSDPFDQPSSFFRLITFLVDMDDSVKSEKDPEWSSREFHRIFEEIFDEHADQVGIPRKNERGAEE